MGESIQCWQCGTRMTLDELASNDGDCPRCEVEVHLAEYLDKALSKVATLEAENAKLRAELERRTPDGWKLVPVEPGVELLTAMSVALGMIPLGDGLDGSYPVTGRQSTVRQCYAAMLAAAPSAPKADPVKVLPYWEPCNPGCDPEFNGQRSSECAGLCHNARAAIAAARQEGGKV